MFFKLWNSFLKTAFYFAPLIFFVNIFLFILISERSAITDNKSYVYSVFNSDLCSFQSSLCRGWTYFFNDFIARFFLFDQPSLFYYFLQYSLYILTILYVLHLSRNLFSDYLPVISSFTTFRFLLLFPSFIYVFQPGKEFFQFISLCLLFTSFHFLIRRSFLQSLFTFSLSFFVALGSHELFYIPIVFIFLIALIAFHAYFKTFSAIKKFTSPLFLFSVIMLFLIISSLLIFKVPYIANGIKFYTAYSLQDLNLLSTTFYPKLSTQNPLYFTSSLLSFSFLPFPVLSSLPVTLFSTIFFLETCYSIYSFLLIYKDARAQILQGYYIKYKSSLFLLTCLIITFLVLFSYWSIGTLNWGTAIRHRAAFVCFLNILNLRYHKSIASPTLS